MRSSVDISKIEPTEELRRGFALGIAEAVRFMRQSAHGVAIDCERATHEDIRSMLNRQARWCHDMAASFERLHRPYGSPIPESKTYENGQRIFVDLRGTGKPFEIGTVIKWDGVEVTIDCPVDRFDGETGQLVKAPRGYGVVKILEPR